MEKMTRDQALIKLLRENEQKDIKIRGLEKDLAKEKKDTGKRLKKLEEDFKRLSRLLVETEKSSRVLKEKSSSMEHDINNVKQVLRRK